MTLQSIAKLSVELLEAMEVARVKYAAGTVVSMSLGAAQRSEKAGRVKFIKDEQVVVEATVTVDAAESTLPTVEEVVTQDAKPKWNPLSRKARSQRRNQNKQG